VLRGIRRTIGSAKQGKAPATADVLMQMVAARCCAWASPALSPLRALRPRGRRPD